MLAAPMSDYFRKSPPLQFCAAMGHPRWLLWDHGLQAQQMVGIASLGTGVYRSIRQRLLPRDHFIRPWWQLIFSGASLPPSTRA